MDHSGFGFYSFTLKLKFPVKIDLGNLIEFCGSVYGGSTLSFRSFPCGKDISKLQVALFCFLGHLSNPNLTDWSPETLDRLWILGSPGNPYLWNWIHQIILKDLRKVPKPFANYFKRPYFWNVGSWKFENLEFLESGYIDNCGTWNVESLDAWNFEILKIWNL